MGLEALAGYKGAKGWDEESVVCILRCVLELGSAPYRTIQRPSDCKSNARDGSQSMACCAHFLKLS